MIKWSAYRYYPARKIGGAFWFSHKVNILKPWHCGDYLISWGSKFETEEECDAECEKRNKRFLQAVGDKVRK